MPEANKIIKTKDKADKNFYESFRILKLIGIKEYTYYGGTDKTTQNADKKYKIWLMDYSQEYSRGLFENPIIFCKWVNDSSIDYIIKNPVPLMDVPCKVIYSKYKGNSGCNIQGKSFFSFVDPEVYSYYKEAVKSLGIE